MTFAVTPNGSKRLLWTPLLLLVVLLAARVPSLVQPAGGDQGLYLYSGQRLLAGAVPYRDMWDQKPPGIAFFYASLLRFWPHESVVAAADFAAAAVVAALLVLIGRRRFSNAIGYASASLFLLLGHPSLQSRLSGVYVRGQCEPFVALAVAATLALVSGCGRRRWPLVLAGVSLGAACWLKYNAATYALPLALAVWAWRDDHDQNRNRGAAIGDLAAIGLGAAILSAMILIYFAANGALHDLWLATIDYNLRYSNETYASPASMLFYIFVLPIARAQVDLLWFLGGVGILLLVWEIRTNRSAVVAIGWVLAGVLSIAVNGQRDLPNYFVQTNPALALAAAAGLGTLFKRPVWLRSAVAALLLAGLWRVGDEPARAFRWGGLPGLVENVRFDVAYASGRVDRATYLQHFRGEKYDAFEIEQLSRYVRESTSPSDPIFVFGFLGGSVCWKSDRASSSRFFWSRPVIIEFAAEQPGYGSTGLLADLRRHPPAIVALQKEQWHSKEFFWGSDPLRTWLEGDYVLDHSSPMFDVWRRRPDAR